MATIRATILSVAEFVTTLGYALYVIAYLMRYEGRRVCSWHILRLSFCVVLHRKCIISNFHIRSRLLTAHCKRYLALNYYHILTIR